MDLEINSVFVPENRRRILLTFGALYALKTLVKWTKVLLEQLIYRYGLKNRLNSIFFLSLTQRTYQKVLFSIPKTKEILFKI